MLGPVSNEDEGAGLCTGCVCALSPGTCVVAGAGARVPGGVVALGRLCGYVGLPGGGPPQLQDVWVRLPEVVKGAEEASLNAGHLLLAEVGVVLVGGVWGRPQKPHEAGCLHVRAEL